MTLVLIACDAQGESGSLVMPPLEEAGHLVEQPCWFDTSTLAGPGVRCATFHVPERWGETSPTLRLPVVVMSLGTRKEKRVRGGSGPDAILVPGGGGPGGSVGLESDRAVSTLEFHQYLVHGTARDLVLIDQRGAGLADPALHCPELEALTVELLSEDQSSEEEDSRWADASGRCARRLEAQGVAPRAFDTRSAARDLDALRTALGYSQWNLFGSSYGGNLALAYARDYPGAVRSLVLESPDVPDDDDANLPENFERVLRALFERCKNDVECARDYPDPAGALDRLLTRLDGEVRIVEAAHPGTLERVTVRVTPARLLDAMTAALYSTERSHDLPRTLTAADRGSFAPVASLVEHYVDNVLDPRFAIGLLEVVTCRESIPGSDLERRHREAQAHPWRQGFEAKPADVRASCEAWKVGDAGPASRATPDFAGPVLILAGELDPVIPVADVRRLAKQLPKSRLILLPATGHDATGAWWECLDALVTDFLRDPDARTATRPEDLACRKRAAGKSFPSLGLREALPPG